MDDRLQKEVLRLVEQLANREKDRFAEPGTFVDIEDLTAKIGDEVTRQLARPEPVAHPIDFVNGPRKIPTGKQVF